VQRCSSWAWAHGDGGRGSRQLRATGGDWGRGARGEGWGWRGQREPERERSNDDGRSSDTSADWGASERSRESNMGNWGLGRSVSDRAVHAGGGDGSRALESFPF
jgi:hypothetical protein